MMCIRSLCKNILWGEPIVIVLTGRHCEVPLESSVSFVSVVSVAVCETIEIDLH